MEFLKKCTSTAQPPHHDVRFCIINDEKKYIKFHDIKEKKNLKNFRVVGVMADGGFFFTPKSWRAKKA